MQLSSLCTSGSGLNGTKQQRQAERRRERFTSNMSFGFEVRSVSFLSKRAGEVGKSELVSRSAQPKLRAYKSVDMRARGYVPRLPQKGTVASTCVSAWGMMLEMSCCGIIFRLGIPQVQAPNQIASPDSNLRLSTRPTCWRQVRSDCRARGGLSVRPVMHLRVPGWNGPVRSSESGHRKVKQLQVCETRSHHQRWGKEQKPSAGGLALFVCRRTTSRVVCERVCVASVRPPQPRSVMNSTRQLSLRQDVLEAC